MAATVIAIGATIAATGAAASVVLTETNLRIRRTSRVLPDEAKAAEAAAPSGARVEAVEIAAADGVALRAWCFTPSGANGEATIVQHGFGDTRHGVLDIAAMLLRHGYAVVTPDSRGHGSSGDALVTFGVRESDDLRRWAAWLRKARAARRVHALGESMGAACVLQALNDPAPFDRVVAECSFTSFPEAARYRLVTRFRLTLDAFARVLSETAFMYARRIRGVDLRRARPIDSIRDSRVPVLLIHGTEDRTIPPDHSRKLHQANPRMTELWEVPGAAHVSAATTAPEEFERRVTEWFRAGR